MPLLCGAEGNGSLTGSGKLVAGSAEGPLSAALLPLAAGIDAAGAPVTLAPGAVAGDRVLIVVTARSGTAALSWTRDGSQPSIA